MTGRRMDRLRAEAGQFFTWRFLTGPGWTRAHPYSLSAAPDGRSLRITVKELGDGSAALRHVRPGTRVLVEGPYGRLSARARTRPKVALIGAGVGITPLRALAEELRLRPGDAVLLYRFSDRPLFAERARRAGPGAGAARSSGCPGAGGRRTPGSATASARVDDLAALTYWVPDIAERDVYVCGPETLGRGRPPHDRRRPACPPTASTSRDSDGDRVKRIVLWFMSTLTVVTLLFGYHTSTSSEPATGGTSSVLAAPGRPGATSTGTPDGTSTGRRRTGGHAAASRSP